MIQSQLRPVVERIASLEDAQQKNAQSIQDEARKLLIAEHEATRKEREAKKEREDQKNEDIRAKEREAARREGQRQTLFNVVLTVLSILAGWLLSFLVPLTMR